MARSLPQDIEDSLFIGNKTYIYYSLKKLEELGFKSIGALPFSLKILLENILRQGKDTIEEDILAFLEWLKKGASSQEILFQPARILMQDFTGVPAMVDLAMMRDALLKENKDPTCVNPIISVDLIVDHSVTVDHYKTPTAYEENVDIELKRNKERYEFLKWGQTAFKNFRVVPPGTGICHQVNLEYLAHVVRAKKDNEGRLLAFPDTVLGTDSHTTMINGLSVLGWGVGGIEAEAALLAQPLSMIIPEVIGVHLKGQLQEGVTATDLVLTITNLLRQKNVVGKFVEYYGDGLSYLSLADRATLANMSPEYGATCGFFPIDNETLSYLRFTGRSEENIQLVEAYAKAQGLWRDEKEQMLTLFSDTLEVDLSTIEPCIAGPKRPQDQIFLSQVPQKFTEIFERTKPLLSLSQEKLKDPTRSIQEGDIAIAAITSCTNTSNPFVMLGAGLLARKALEKGLIPMPWVKTSLAPGSQVVTSYLEATHLQKDLDCLGFNLVGYGCTTCIGNSGPLNPSISRKIQEQDLVVCAVLSGNRNFDGRINPLVQASFLASPPLVIAYALVGSIFINLREDILGFDQKGNPVYLKDIWPSNKEIQSLIQSHISPQMFIEKYKTITEGTNAWHNFKVPQGITYNWNPTSTYVKKPPFLDPPLEKITKIHIEQARALLILGNSVTTDHISPAGAIKMGSPAADYLMEQGIKPVDFNAYGSRRGNHEVMVRGTFANIRLNNFITPDIPGGITKYFPKDPSLAPDILSVFDAAQAYRKEQTPLVVIAGKEYGTGSSRDWAAKGPKLLGIQAIIAESFERIHRSNLIGMGILPFELPKGVTAQLLNLTGEELFDITAKENHIKPKMKAILTIHYPKKMTSHPIELLCRIDTQEEVAYLEAGGILPFVLKGL